MMNQLALAIVMIVLAFSAGWKTKSWQADSVQLYIDKVAAVFTKEAKSREAAVAVSVQKALKESIVHERIIERQLQPIINREVYTQDCIDADGLDVINSLLLREAPADSDSS